MPGSVISQRGLAGSGSSLRRSWNHVQPQVAGGVGV